MKVKVSNLIATMIRIGYLPIAPGTWGSFAALLLWFVIIQHISTFTLIALTLVLFVLGVYTSSVTENETQKDDPSVVVIDEWVGQWIALLFLPKSILWGTIAFILFRVFDIWKPYPIKKLDNLHGGLGIMLDDVLAGVYALTIVQLLRLLFI